MPSERTQGTVRLWVPWPHVLEQLAHPDGLQAKVQPATSSQLCEVAGLTPEQLASAAGVPSRLKHVTIRD